MLDWSCWCKRRTTMRCKISDRRERLHTPLCRYDMLPQKRLASPEEINAYVEALRRELVKALNECDVIQMNQ